jgi:hypothetical protein
LTDVAIENTYWGIFNGSAGLKDTFGHVYRSVLLSTRGAGIHLHRSTGCRLYDVLSDHANIQNQEQVDIFFNGNSQYGGGLVLINVVAASARGDGIVFKDFLQIWGCHVSGDVCGGVGITFDHTQEVYIFGLFASVNLFDNVTIKNQSAKITLVAPQFAASRQGSGLGVFDSQDITLTSQTPGNFRFNKDA